MAYFDLRLPLGWLFLIVGCLLIIAGFLVQPVASDGHVISVNVNIGWGVVLLFFGAICLLAAWSHAARQQALQRKMK